MGFFCRLLVGCICAAFIKTLIITTTSAVLRVLQRVITLRLLLTVLTERTDGSLVRATAHHNLMEIYVHGQFSCDYHRSNDDVSRSASVNTVWVIVICISNRCAQTNYAQWLQVEEKTVARLRKSCYNEVLGMHLHVYFVKKIFSPSDDLCNGIIQTYIGIISCVA